MTDRAGAATPPSAQRRLSGTLLWLPRCQGFHRHIPCPCTVVSPVKQAAGCSGAQPIGPRTDADAAQVEPIGIPAGLQRAGAVGKPVGVQFAGVIEKFEPLIVKMD